MDQYCILGRIGEGAHGIVFKAKHVETGEIVALKKVALRRLEDGIPNQALREIKALQEIEDNQYALLHQYFFTAPLPAHPSELPIPQRPGGLAPKAHPGPPNIHDFHVDRPLEELLLNPELIRPFIPEG
uniref:Cyclin-dependent kinase 20 n=1 Tax=Molossus molossus TaxID=27622 RepID=A0A7J8ED65_MOLMO|nr:cyclin dependent kinase 20 [Molossus molossus]